MLAEAAAGSTSSATWVQGTCSECGEGFVRRGTASTCCSKRCNQRRWRRSNKHKIVSRRKRLEIYERDGWVCQLCFEPVDPAEDGQWGHSLDHIDPRSKGGSDEPGNLRLAHRWCNAVRGDLSWHSEDVLRVF